MFRQLSEKSIKQNQREQDALFEALDEMAWGSVEVKIPLASEVEMLEKERITAALSLHNGNRTKTADHLGIGRTLLIHKLKKYNLV